MIRINLEGCKQKGFAAGRGADAARLNSHKYGARMRLSEKTHAYVHGRLAVRCGNNDSSRPSRAGHLLIGVRSNGQASSECQACDRRNVRRAFASRLTDISHALGVGRKACPGSATIRGSRGDLTVARKEGSDRWGGSGGAGKKCPTP
jgi:hypothetical protein